jgi:catechol 2,3-dioxygenase-like lactoylglutathione lyase family enzyme
VKATALNHVSINALDLEQSVRFYEDFFGLRRLPTPDFGYPVQWLELGDRQLHIFVRATEAPELHHFAVDVDDYAGAYQEAKRRGILEGRPRRFPDGGVQMYVRDPAGNRVELDWPDASLLDAEIFGEMATVPGPAEATLYTGRG